MYKIYEPFVKTNNFVAHHYDLWIKYCRVFVYKTSESIIWWEDAIILYALNTFIPLSPHYFCLSRDVLSYWRRILCGEIRRENPLIRSTICGWNNKALSFKFKHILLSYKCTIRLETSYINLVYPLYTIMLYTFLLNYVNMTSRWR
jgi:hypothetical protein